MSFFTYIVFSAICLVSMHLMLLADVNKYAGVSIGSAILVTCCIVYLVFRFALRRYTVRRFERRFKTALPFLPVNAIGCGLAMSSLYVHLGEAPNVLTSFCVWIAYAVLFAVYCFLGNIPLFKRFPRACLLIYGLLVVVAGIIGICVSTVIFSLVLMMFILFITHLATILVRSVDYIEHIHNLVLVSFIELLIVVIVVLIVISGGDGLDGLDGGGAGSGGGYRDPKYNPYDFGATNEEKKRWLNKQ